jgi:dipeptidase D
MNLKDLEPKILWKYFDEIRNIPRCSKHEEKIARYIVGTARKLGLEVFQDEVGNVIVRKRASPGYENVPMITLQCHIDMVCEKNANVERDFEKSGIEAYIDGDYVKARGTTLGADDGIGVAACLAMMEESAEHGPLEFLFTIDEETGMTGAFNVKKDYIKGEMLLNLDSEEFGSIYIGCAGGANSDIVLPLKFENVDDKGIRISVKGLKGGHSGVEIDRGRANSINLLARLLYNINARISRIKGGDKFNAIPREATAEVMVSDIERTKEKISELERAFREEYKRTDPDLKVEVNDRAIKRVIEREINENVIELLMALPHGVLSMSQEVEGLVETSTNLAKVEMDGEMHVVMSSRSSIDSALNSILQRIRCISRLAGASVKEGSRYPGWKPNRDSKLLKVAMDAFRELYDKEPEIKAIHAGLETGVIGERIGLTEMISFGPDIEHPHSPDERVSISSVENFWKYLLHLIKKLAKEWR